MQKLIIKNLQIKNTNLFKISLNSLHFSCVLLLFYNLIARPLIEHMILIILQSFRTIIMQLISLSINFQ